MRRWDFLMEAVGLIIIRSIISLSELHVHLHECHELPIYRGPSTQRFSHLPHNHRHFKTLTNFNGLFNGPWNCLRRPALTTADGN